MKLARFTVEGSDNLARNQSLDLEQRKSRKQNLISLLEVTWELLVKRGWWSYLTKYPVLDHEVIMSWIAKKKVSSMVSVHYLFDANKKMWEIGLAMTDPPKKSAKFELLWPHPPGRIRPEQLNIEGDNDA